MLVKIVDTVVATDSVGRPVDAIPVREWVEGETDAAGRPVAPVAIEEDDNGVPVRFVAGKSAQNSAGQWVDTIAVTGGAAQAQMKRAVPASADVLYVNQQDARSGKFLSLKIVKNIDGTNDAGTAHEPWRLSQIYVTDAIGDNPNLINYKPISGNNGARDYALKSVSSLHGGSYHGGEANAGTLRAWHGALAGQTSPLLLADGAAWNPAAATDARRFEFHQSSTITWAAQAGQTATVDSRMVVNQDGTVEMWHRLEGNFVGGIPPNNLSYPTLDYVAPRYSRMTYGATTVDLISGENNLPSDCRAIRLTDPATGDYADMEWTADRAIGRQYVLVNANNSKLYVADPAGATMGAWDVYKKTTYSIAPIAAPALPYTDTFAGSALSSWWTLSNTSGAPSIAVTGGEWVITGNGIVNRWTHPICDAESPGTYHVELDYATDGNYTGAQLIVVRHNSGSISNPLQTFNLNSVAGTTLAFDLQVLEGEAPYLLMTPGVSPRVARIRELRISKTA